MARKDWPLWTQRAIRALESEGFTVLRTKSYRQAQERQRVAECMMRSEERSAESARAWARQCLDEERRLRSRCEFLATLALSKGATLDDLSVGP